MWPVTVAADTPPLQGIILTYDISAVQSFNLLTKWMGYVQTVSPDGAVPVCLASQGTLVHMQAPV